MEMKDLTPEELVKYLKDELNQDITLEEAKSMKRDYLHGGYVKKETFEMVFNTKFSSVLQNPQKN